MESSLSVGRYHFSSVAINGVVARLPNPNVGTKPLRPASAVLAGRVLGVPAAEGAVAADSAACWACRWRRRRNEQRGQRYHHHDQYGRG
jgi:hypothetical protein